MKRMTSFVCEEKVLSQINLIAKADGKSRSQVLREAVARYVEQQTEHCLESVAGEPATTD